MPPSADHPEKRLVPENVARRLRVILVYLTGQGFAQLFNLLTGLLLLRWLSVEQYAQFIVAFTFQLTLGFLTDLGFSGTIVALVGPRGNDPTVVGSYVRSGRHLRNVMMLCLTPIAAIFYIQIARQHHWAAFDSMLLFSSIVASIYFSGMLSYYGAPLLIRGQLTHYYRHQLIAAVLRISACGVLFLVGALSAWTTSWVNSLSFLLIGWLYARESRPYASLPARHDSKTTKQMVQYVLPNLPSYIFFSLQGQIALFLISFFGRTRSIAEVGALGRLGQLFLLLSGINSTVLEPFIARLPEQRVSRSYLLIGFAAAAICVPLCFLGFLGPQFLLILLGPKYASLGPETGFLVLSSCIGYLVGVHWTMIAARRWIYWTTTWTTICMIFVSQILFLFFFRVDSTLHAVLFGLVTNLGYLAATLFNAFWGFIHGPKIKIGEAATVDDALHQVAVIEQIMD